MDTKSFFRRNKKQTTSAADGRLAKLKFYCQQCSKQCRDANALKQHNLSATHIAKTARLNPEAIANYNDQLTEQFLSFLKTNGGRSAWNDANKIYNKFVITERDHVHMVSTSFNNLSQFIGYVSKQKKILVKKPDVGGDLIEDGEYSKYLIKLADDSSKSRLFESEVFNNENEEKRQQALMNDMLRQQREEMEKDLAKVNDELQECETKPAVNSIQLSSLNKKKIVLQKGNTKKSKKSKPVILFE